MKTDKQKVATLPFLRVALACCTILCTVGTMSGCSFNEIPHRPTHESINAAVNAEVDAVANLPMFKMWQMHPPTVVAEIPVYATTDNTPDYYLELLDCAGTFCGSVLVDVRFDPAVAVTSNSDVTNIWTNLKNNRTTYLLGFDWFYVPSSGEESVVTTLPPYEISARQFKNILHRYRTKNSPQDARPRVNKTPAVKSVERPLYVSDYTTQELNSLRG